MEKHWVARAMACLKGCRESVPHEINELDWKCGVSDNKDRMIEHLIAFANNPNGGFLVYGIANDGTEIGVTQNQVENAIALLTNLGRDGVEPPLILDHTVKEIDAGKTLLFIFIAEQRTKPVYRRGKSIEETWVRSGGTTRKASRHDVANLLLQGKTPCWEEIRASSLLTEIEVKDHLNISAITKMLNRPLANDQAEIMRWLIDERMVIADSNGYYITNFGAISAAYDLNQFGSLARKSIRVIQYKGTNKVDTIDEEIDKKGYAIGFEGLINSINRLLPHSEIIQQSLRTNVTLYPEIVLRELIANALIHQDFTITGAGPTIEIFQDRIEFTSPGVLLPGKKPDRLIGTAPESRNELLASAFRRYRICEERGTGFQKVIAAIELFGMPPVYFQTLENAFRVILFAPRKFANMAQSERIEACYQHAVLQYLSSKALTNTTLRERFKIHDKHRNQITNLIAEAVSMGRIKRKENSSGKKFAEYYPYWA